LINVIEILKILHNQEYRGIDPNNPKKDGTLFIHFGNTDSPFKYEKITEDLNKTEEEKNKNEQSETFEGKSEKKKMLRNQSFFISEATDISIITTQFLEKNNEDLLKIFQFYCSLGEPLNTCKMKSIKFKKFLKDANILLNLSVYKNNHYFYLF